MTARDQEKVFIQIRKISNFFFFIFLFFLVFFVFIFLVFLLLFRIIIIIIYFISFYFFNFFPTSYSNWLVFLRWCNPVFIPILLVFLSEFYFYVSRFIRWEKRQSCGSRESYFHTSVDERDRMPSVEIWMKRKICVFRFGQKGINKVTPESRDQAEGSSESRE